MMRNHLHLPGISITVVFIIIFILGYSIASVSTAESSSDVIRVENGMLTISMSNIPLIDVLEKIANQTGIGFELYGEDDRKITANYAEISLAEGLRRLLRPYNHIILYTAKRPPSQKPRIQKIIVYDKAGKSGGRGIKRDPVEMVNVGAGNRNDLVSNRNPVEQDTKRPLADYAKQLNDADPDIREEAISEMAEEYETAALIYLEKALLHDGNDEIRAAAAEEIGELESVLGIEVLAKGLNDPDEDVREAVVDALGEIGGKSALPVLRRALNDKNEEIREAVADLIEEIEEEENGG